MPRKNIDVHYIDVAHLVSELSYDSKIPVGSIIVKDHQIISQGYNGTPSGMSNDTRVDGITKPEVVHSEMNALMKLAKNGGGSNGAVFYCTHSPCMECAKAIVQAGIERVVYTNQYSIESLKFLKERGLSLEQVNRSSGGIKR